MKQKGYIFYSIIIFILCAAIENTYGQIYDENTAIITRYFQNSSSQEKSATITDEAQLNNFRKYKSSVNILQDGNLNYTNINSKASELGVEQIGNNNNYEFMSYYGRDDLNFDIQQIGNNNLIQVFGENRLIDNLKIIQKSDFKTITITNY